MKLTEQQSKIVADNHKLIYWIANLKGLHIDEYYDLLAIELCKTVQKYKPDKGGLPNFYKLRVEYMLGNEFQKRQAQKRAHQGVYDIEENFGDDITLTQLSYDYNEDIMESILLKELTEGEFGDIIRLKWQGYSQSEIAEILGVSQGYISKALKKVRDELDE